MNRVRLVERVPRVYVGPDAERAMSGEKGVLLGTKRPHWVDVLQFDPRQAMRWKQLVELRFARATAWEVVGISLPSAEFGKLEKRLLVELVPGDVLLTDKGPSVHLGNAWIEAKLAAR